MTAGHEAWDLLRREARRRGVTLAVVAAEAIEEKADRIEASMPEPHLTPGRGNRERVPGDTSEPIAAAAD